MVGPAEAPPRFRPSPTPLLEKANPGHATPRIVAGVSLVGPSRLAPLTLGHHGLFWEACSHAPPPHPPRPSTPYFSRQPTSRLWSRAARGGRHEACPPAGKRLEGLGGGCLRPAPPPRRAWGWGWMPASCTQGAPVEHGGRPDARPPPLAPPPSPAPLPLPALSRTRGRSRLDRRAPPLRAAVAGGGARGSPPIVQRVGGGGSPTPCTPGPLPH